MPDTTIYLKDYQAPAFRVETIDLDFDLYDDYALVKSLMRLNRQHEGDLILCGDELELLSLSLNGNLLTEENYRLEEENLIIKQCQDTFTLEIVTRIRPQDNTELSGLYLTKQLFCTQCEAEGFRRITFYLDRPDVLAKFTTRITADKAKYPVLLSNGNLVSSGIAENGRHWVLWEDPFKKPSYLFALVAGNLACVKDEFITCSGKKVSLHLYVEPGNEDKCGHAMVSLKKAMHWDEEMYGREYDLDIFMIVAVSDFNMGAMENKGLNIFNAKYILARPDTATDDDYGDIEAVVGHEYFHNWTGNRITCRDWFQLSLKEGLTVFRDQEFSRDMNSRDVNRITDVQILRSSQFPEDAGSMAHPVRPASYQEINNFYTSTVYNKGAEVIRMQETLLTKEGFRRGMDLYFQRHDGQAVTIDNFVAAMEDANLVDLTQFKLWYSQAGTPEIKVSSQFNEKEGKLTLTLSQYCPPTPESQEKKPFHIPVRMALFSPKGEILPLKQEVLELKQEEQDFHFMGLQEKPIVSLLRDFSAPVKLHQPLSQAELLALLKYETNGFAKWNAAQTLAINCMLAWLSLPAGQWQIPQELIIAYNHVLNDETLDQALRAEILSPPGFEELIASLTLVDVDAIEKVRDFFHAELGRSLYAPLKAMYKRLWEEEDHLMQADAYKRRSLRNTCLCLLMKGEEAQSLKLCIQQFNQAQTMTDKIASLSILSDCTIDAAREEAINSFYRQWAHEELVVDKWFAIQATSELPGTLEKVKALLQHSAFNIKTPNKVRAVVGAFCLANPRHFHAIDGSGYIFLKEMLVKIDKINPQIAARLANPFTLWCLFNEARQELMLAQLKELAQLKLSRDLREIVEKSLVDADAKASC